MTASSYRYLNRIDSPDDLKKLSLAELRSYCDELRDYIIEQLAHNPGHLGSSLGVVELTAALHYVFRTPYDRIVWDVGHQAYAHKIITGRRDRFPSNRRLNGLSGFPRMDESAYDAFGGGHASTSISAALGMASAAALQGERRHVVAVIGDGALTGVLSFEGLNNACATNTDLLGILNDNRMAIDPNVGALKEYLLSITTSQRYNRAKNHAWSKLERMPRLRRWIQKIGNVLKYGFLQQSNLFESLNFRYFGPVDGHDLAALTRVLEDLRKIKGPKLLHVLTVKGKGYLPAEQNQKVWHAPGAFDPTTGERAAHHTCSGEPLLYQEVFGHTLLELARNDRRIVGITPAMPSGCSLNIMMQQMPERCFDVGIAEEHAVTFSAGLAAEGMTPFCNIYSSFLQRAYDQVVHDVALQGLHVVLCIDRAGIVGEDGATHQGILDIAYLRSIPEMTVAAPMDETELRNMMYTASLWNGPFAIRYPRGRGTNGQWQCPMRELNVGEGRRLSAGDRVALLSLGHPGLAAAEAAARARAEGVSVEHIDLRFAKPLDQRMLHEVGRRFERVITVEEGVTQGGVGSAVLEFFADNGYAPRVRRLGVPNRFVPHGKQAQLRALCGLDAESIYQEIMKINNQQRIMEYNFAEIEKKWQQRWIERRTYRVEVDPKRPKFYVLDMFPYPSGAGLHVGHPLGYIASDIYARYKRLKGFNVLHPMGYDAFGLPAEQYAIQTGQHPAVTTENNIARYREQLDKIGFSFDWNREVRTCDPKYYHWTQWAFLKMFDSYYCNKAAKALPIEQLVAAFEQSGTEGLDVACTEELHFTAAEWRMMSSERKEQTLQNYRLAFRADTMVNWCAGLGTVLANDEVKDGLSVRGGYPVVQKKMKQWLLRVTAYAQRMLDGLDTLEWSDSLKEIQRNWIGRSEGAQVFFGIKGSDKKLEIFTTRADTIFGVTFMVLAPEHEWVAELTTPDRKAEVEQYIEQTKKRSERERMADTRSVSGVFTGAYALNPFNGVEIPIYLSDYVLAGYGTGAIMAVPAHDSRDYAFAKHFDLPIIPVVEGGDLSTESYDAKSGRMINSDFLTGMDVKQAIPAMIDEVERRGFGSRKINYRLRDAIFSRQRYWGEPFPIYYKDDVACPMAFDKLPLELPAVSDFGPTSDGEPPLARVKEWHTAEGYPYELSTMPGFAGSSAYYLRYMDPHNDRELVSAEADHYWRNVDLYVGGIEHATGHLMYSRFWNMFLYDLGYVCEKEPFKKLINQGMIQGRSNFVYRIKGTNKYVSLGLKDRYDTQEIHVNVNIVHNDVLDLDAFRKWMPEFADAEFELEEGKYICGWAVEKMSKSMYNVVNPDHIVRDYGADTLRMYEMFLGPLEQSKPWDTNGIDGVHKFLRRFWRLFFDRDGKLIVTDGEPTAAELKTLHKTVKKVSEDIENFSFNTSVSAFMICVNELVSAGCAKRAVLEPLVVLIASFAPHIAEEIWEQLGHTDSVCDARFPEYDAKHLAEDSCEYPISFNGKVRFKLPLSRALAPKEVETAVLNDPMTLKYLDGKTPRKVIVVPCKIVNIVC